MNITDNITKYTDLKNEDSLSHFMGHAAQQSHNVYQIFYDFLSDIKPARILEIGTSLGGFTTFLRICCDTLGLSSTNIRSYDIHEHSWFKDIIEKNIDLRVENIFSEGFKSCNQEVVNYVQQDGVTIVLCDGGWKIGEFNLFSKHIKTGDYILAHDYSFSRETYEEKIKNKIWNWCGITEEDISQASIENNLIPYKQEVFDNAVWVCKVKAALSSN